MYYPGFDRRKDFSKSFNRFSTASENVSLGSKKLPIFRCFSLVVTWFFDFFKKFQKHNEPCTGRRIRAKFRAYPSGDSLGIVAAEKEKKTRTEMRSVSNNWTSYGLWSLFPAKRHGRFCRRWYRLKAHHRNHRGRHRNYVPILWESWDIRLQNQPKKLAVVYPADTVTIKFCPAFDHVG